MKIKLSVLAILLVLPSLIMSGQEEFEIWLDSSNDETSRDMIMNSENNYIGIIRKSYEPDQFPESYIYKISRQGDTISMRFIKKDTIIGLDKIIEVSESPIEYIICGTGHHKDSSASLWFSYFVKIDDNLNIIWERTYHLHNVNEYTCLPLYSQLLKKPSGGYLHANSLVPWWKMFFFELNEDGDSIAYRMYDGDSTGIISGLTYNSDSTAYWAHISGGRYEPDPPECQCVELNFQLEQVKIMNYPRYFESDITPKLLPNGDLVTASVYRNAWIPEEYVAAFKFDSAFNILGECMITSPDTANQKAQRSLDFVYPSYIYFGGTHNFQIGIWVPGPSWFVLGRLNEHFELEKELYIGGDATYNLKTITATADSGVLITGTWYDYSSQSYERDVIILKLSKDGIITGNSTDKVIPVSEVIVYPNPGNTQFNIRTSIINSKFKMWDSNGNLVIDHIINQKNSNINTSHFKPGNYIWKLINDSKTIETGKWIRTN